MGIMFSLRGVLALAICALLAACSSGEPAASPPGWSACYVGTDAQATCFATELKLPDDKLYALDTCRSGNGVLKDACPAQNLVGSCGSLGSARTSKGIVPRQVRRYHYLHPDLTDPRLIEKFRSSCITSAGDWQEPPSADTR
jgi:hypothetical protein